MVILSQQQQVELHHHEQNPALLRQCDFAGNQLNAVMSWSSMDQDSALPPSGMLPAPLIKLKINGCVCAAAPLQQENWKSPYAWGSSGALLVLDWVKQVGKNNLQLYVDLSQLCLI